MGFTRYQHRRTVRSKFYLGRTLILMAMAGGLLYNQLALPNPPLAPTATSPSTQKTEVWYQSDPTESDMGYPMRQRPDHNSPVGVPLKEGTENWTGQNLGAIYDNPQLTEQIRRIGWRILGEQGLEGDERLYAFVAWLPRAELARWTWLVENGHAGWRTLENCLVNRVKGRTTLVRSAQDHWDIHTALTAGFTISAIGWTEYTQSVSGTTYYISTSGDDGTGDGSIGNPWKSPYKGRDAWVSGHDDYVLLLRSDMWYNPLVTYPQIGDMTNKHGVSEAVPALFGSYGEGGDRPILDLTGQASAGANVRVGSKWVHFQSLDIRDGTYTGGTGPQSQITGINFTDGAVGCQVENCKFTLMTCGINADQGSGGTDTLTLRRCVILSCFSTVNSQQGVGIFIQGFSTSFTMIECVLDHNGWTEGDATHTGTAQARTATTITLANSASTLNDAYNGALVSSGGKSGTITDYVGATRVATLAGGWAGGTPALGDYTVVGSQRRLFCHNSYVTNTTKGYTAYRNVATRGANHGFGRRNGYLYYNYAEQNVTGIIVDADGADPDGHAQSVHDNVVIGCDFANLFDVHGQSAVIGIQATSADAVNAVSSNCVVGLEYTDSSVAITGIVVGTGTVWSIQNNVIHNWYNINTGSTRCLKIRPTQTASHVVTGNRISQPSDGYLIEIEEAGGSPTYSFNNTYYRNSQSVAFYDGGDSSWTSWQSERSDIGSFHDPYVSPYNDPNRNLATYDALLVGGESSLNTAIQRLCEFDIGTWTEETHGAIPRINHVREGFNMSPIALAWSGETIESPVNGFRNRYRSRFRYWR